MKNSRHTRKIATAVLVIAVAVAAFAVSGGGSAADFMAERRDSLASLVHENYAEAVLIFMLLYLATALLLPGALPLTITAGMIFGTIPAVIYVNIAATTGAAIAFLITRRFFGQEIQNHFGNRLRWLNHEISKHGGHYLISLRILPVLPFFLVNYCAALTTIRFRTFVWTTSLGMLPGSVIYAFAGDQFGSVRSAGDLFSVRILVALLLLSFFSLLPVMVNHLKAWHRRKSGMG